MPVLSKPIKRYTLMLSVCWTVVIICSFAWSYSQQHDNILEIARSEARIAFQKDTLYRKWATKHGGVYVPVTGETQPNPDLSYIPERDISTPSGKPLTLINPAYMTRQVFELATREDNFVRGHITSLKPIRPQNAPDQWEAVALNAFERGVKEVSEVQVIEGQQYLRLMRPFITEQACLKCHAAQGYKLGDIRGGISVSVPLAVLSVYSKRILAGTGAAHGLLWLLGIGMLGVGSRKLSQSADALYEKNLRLEEEVAVRQLAQEKLQEQASLLEEEIGERQMAQESLQEQTVMLEEEIAERKQAEEQREQFYTFFMTSSDLMCIADPNGAFLKTNPACSETLGYSEAELVAQPFINFVHPDDKQATVDEMAQQQKTGYSSAFENRYMCKNGAFRWLSWRAVYNKNEGITYATARDVTAVKQGEEEKSALEGQLQQAQKMESIGRLAGGVAHDFNNILTVIQGHSQLGLIGVDPKQPIYSHLDEICKASGRAADLTRQLLAFARKQTVTPKVLNLNEVVAGMLNMLQRLIGEDIHLTWQAAANLWPVKIDPSQIDQVLANLCVNARDAIADVGEIGLKTGNCGIDATYCAHHADAMPGEYVWLSVSDTGCGMDKEVQAHIFEPFFTTKETGKGTGLGLATVYGIVKQNNGFISIQTEPDCGTTFTMYLPRHVGDVAQAGTEDTLESALRGQETILLVEDDPSILSLTSQFLKNQGYAVLSANGPDEANRLACEQAGAIHLLITDVVMPKMNGRDLSRMLLSRHPHLKCLFMSGYTADAIAHHGVLEEGVHFIQKPFSLVSLAAMVREVLDSK